MIRFIMLYSCLVTVTAVAVTLEQIGNVYRFTSNEMLAEVMPEAGGRVSRLVERKSGRVLTKHYPTQQAPAGSGLLLDRLWPLKGAAFRHYENTAYHVMSARNDANKAELVLRCESQPLIIEKSISIREGARRLHVTYALSNPTDEDFVGRYWSCNVLTVSDKAWKIRLPFGETGEDIRRSGIPGETLVDYVKKTPRSGNYFVGKPTHDFAVFYDEKTRQGAALLAPYEWLEYFYCHVPAAGDPQLPTGEWMSSPLQIRPLKQGRAEAIIHPELDDPLQDYIVRFTMDIELVDQFDYRNFRPAPKTPKTTRFMPVLESPSPHYTGFPTSVALYANQKEKPLVITACSAAVSSELFDFARHFNCECEAVEGWAMHTSGQTQYYGWDIPHSESMLQKQLNRKPDVVILPGTFETALSKPLKTQLMNLVRSGKTTVIYVSSSNRFPALMSGHGTKLNPEALLRGIPLQVNVKSYQLGKGKTYWVPFRLHCNHRVWAQNSLLIPVPENRNPPKPAYYYAFYGRLIRHALGYESDAIITKATLQKDELAVTIQSKKHATATLNGKPLALKPGDNAIAIPLNLNKPNGLYDQFLTLDLNGATTDVFIARVPVRNDSLIKNLSPEKYAYEPYETIKGTVTVQGIAADLTVQLKDAAGRIVARESHSQARGNVSFALKPELDGVNSLLNLSAELRQGKTLVDSQTIALSRRTPDDSRLRFVIWHNSSTSHSGELRRKALAQIGFTHILGGQSHAGSHFDIRWAAEKILSYGARYMANTLYRFSQPSKQKQYLVRKPCLRNPDDQAKIREKVHDAVTKHAGNFPVFYYSADENSLGYYNSPHDFCHSPYCLTAFRTHLKKKYGSLSNLNHIWNTNFTTWKSINPPTLNEARKKHDFTLWMEHRRFMLGAIPTGVHILKDELLKTDPQARLAHSGQGMTGSNDLWDWRVLLNEYSMSGLYDRDGGLPDLVRSLKPEHAAGMWNGYNAPLHAIRSNCWNDLANGLFAPAYWYDAYFYRRGDNQLNQAGLHMKRLIAEVNNSGVDPLCTQGNRVTSPFTLVYSPDSMIASVATGADSILGETAYTANYDGWTQMLRAAGYAAPQVMDSSKLNQLAPARNKAVILPMMQLMSQKDVTHVQNYVRQGGILIMDAQAGILDDFCTPRHDNPMMAMAGIRGKRATGTGDGTITFREQPIRLTSTGAHVMATTAKPYGKVLMTSPKATFEGINLDSVSRKLSDAFCVNNYGKGKVIYLNGILDSYVLNQVDSQAVMPLLTAFQQLFSDLGIEQRQSIAPGVNSAEYRHGPFRTFLFVRRNGTGTISLNYPLNDTLHLYDTLKHRYLGKGNHLHQTLKAHDIHMIATTKHPLDAMRCKGSFDGRVITLTVRQRPGGVLRLELFRTGVPVQSLSRSVAFQDTGTWRFDLGLAPCEPWTLKVLNVMSGETFNYEAIP